MVSAEESVKSTRGSDDDKFKEFIIRLGLDLKHFSNPSVLLTSLSSDSFSAHQIPLSNEQKIILRNLLERYLLSAEAKSPNAANPGQFFSRLIEILDLHRNAESRQEFLLAISKAPKVRSSKNRQLKEKDYHAAAESVATAYVEKLKLEELTILTRDINKLLEVQHDSAKYQPILPQHRGSPEDLKGWKKQSASFIASCLSLGGGFLSALVAISAPIALMGGTRGPRESNLEDFDLHSSDHEEGKEIFPLLFGTAEQFALREALSEKVDNQGILREPLNDFDFEVLRKKFEEEYELQKKLAAEKLYESLVAVAEAIKYKRQQKDRSEISSESEIADRVSKTAKLLELILNPSVDQGLRILLSQRDFHHALEAVPTEMQIIERANIARDFNENYTSSGIENSEIGSAGLLRLPRKKRKKLVES